MSRTLLVLHDWNGCLLDDVPHRFEHGPCAIFRRYGLPRPDIYEYCRNISSDFMEWYYSHGFPRGDKKADGDALNAIMKEEMARAPMPPLFPETRQFLAILRSRGLRQNLVSALEEGEFRRQVGYHALGGFFDEMRGGVRKKAPVFREMMEAYAVAPEEAVGVTDTMSDAVALAEVGAKPILIPRGYVEPDRAKVPTLIIAENLIEALDHIL